MTKDELNFQIGWQKIEDFRSRLTPAIYSTLSGNAVWVHNETMCSAIKQDQSSISKALKKYKVPGTNKELKSFADSILANECKHLRSNPDDIIAMTDTAYGIYISIISNT
jgi:hypothetical protein